MADGSGVIAAVLDSGITLNRNVFKNANGESKILSVWDQTVPYSSETAGNRYGLGRIYGSEEINSELEKIAGNGSVNGRPSGAISNIARDVNGHGTRVAGIIAENAPGAEFIIVKLAGGNKAGFAKTTSIMYGVDYCVKYAQEAGRPCVINLSYGNNSGGHDGRAILETYLDSVAESYTVSIVVATGNEGDKAHHKEINIEGRTEVNMLMGQNEQDLTLEIWKSYQDSCEIILVSPAGEAHVIEPGFDIAVLEGVRVAIYYAGPTPFEIDEEIRLLWVDAAVPSGIWKVVFEPEEIRYGRVDLWLPVSEGISGDTRFTEPTVDTTLTIPSTAAGVISVGAFNAEKRSLASFSGNGYTRDGRIKPDIVAPGVDVETVSPTGSSVSSGTSFAAPFISARAAVLMSEGIVEKKDPFLYGERLKAVIISEAERLPGRFSYPNPQTGWGSVS